MIYQATRGLGGLATGDGRKFVSPDSVEVGEKDIKVRRWVREDLGKREEIMPYSRIASVRLTRGITTATLIIETTGGGTISIPGMPKAVADAAARDIRSRLV